MSGRVRPASEGELTADWRKNANPGTNAQASATQPAAGAGQRNILTALSATFVAGSAAPSATTVDVAVIDGDTGGTTYLWGPHPIGIPAMAGATNGIALGGLWIPGSPNTKMTIEFSGAGGANTKQSVWMSGTTIQA